MDRSMNCTVTLSVEELFGALASPAVATVAVLPMLPEAETLTFTTSGIVVAEVPAPIGPLLVQVTTWPAAPQAHPAAVPDTKLNALFNVSLTVIPPVVAAVPTLLTAILNVPLLPAVKLPV